MMLPFLDKCPRRLDLRGRPHSMVALGLSLREHDRMEGHMKRPSEEQFRRAATIVAQVARIPGLENGAVVMPADTLDHVRWQADRWGYDPHTQVLVELPFPYDDEERALVAARRRVQLGMDERQDELEEWVKEMKGSKRHPTASDEAAAAMYQEPTAELTAIQGGK